MARGAFETWRTCRASAKQRVAIALRHLDAALQVAKSVRRPVDREQRRAQVELGHPRILCQRRQLEGTAIVGDRTDEIATCDAHIRSVGVAVRVLRRQILDEKRELVLGIGEDDVVAHLRLLVSSTCGELQSLLEDTLGYLVLQLGVLVRLPLECHPIFRHDPSRRRKHIGGKGWRWLTQERQSERYMQREARKGFQGRRHADAHCVYARAARSAARCPSSRADAHVREIRSLGVRASLAHSSGPRAAAARIVARGFSLAAAPRIATWPAPTCSRTCTARLGERFHASSPRQ